MAKRLYYNPSSAQADLRKDLGYGKAQKIPSLGTGVGSEAIMGSSETGIYTEPSDKCFLDDDPESFGFDEDDIDAFVKKINMYHIRPDTSRWPRADRSSLGSSSNRWDLAMETVVPVPKGQPLPKARRGISPFSHRTLYPNDFDGPPLGTGNAGQAFNTTGPARKTGTQYGSSRAPLGTADDSEIENVNFLDIIDMDPDERSILKQRIKIMRILDTIDEGINNAYW